MPVILRKYAVHKNSIHNNKSRSQKILKKQKQTTKCAYLGK